MKLIKDYFILLRVMMPKIEDLSDGVLDVSAKVDGCALKKIVFFELLSALHAFRVNLSKCNILLKDPRRENLAHKSIKVLLIDPHAPQFLPT